MKRSGPSSGPLLTLRALGSFSSYGWIFRTNTTVPSGAHTWWTWTVQEKPRHLSIKEAHPAGLGGTLVFPREGPTLPRLSPLPPEAKPGLARGESRLHSFPVLLNCLPASYHLRVIPFSPWLCNTQNSSGQRVGAVIPAAGSPSREVSPMAGEY